MSRLKKFTKIIVGVFAISILAAPFIVDFFSLSREKSSLLLGEDGDLNLLCEIAEIDPNSTSAEVTFSLIEDNPSMLKDSTKPRDFDIWVFSGSPLIFGDNQLVYAMESRYHSEFVKLSNATTFEVGGLRVIKYTSAPITIKVDAETKGHLFPFDQYLLRLNFELIDYNGERRYPTINTYSNESRLFVSKSIRNYAGGRKMMELPNSFILMYTRPNYVFVNFVLIVLISLLVISWSFYRIVSKNQVTALEVIGVNITILISFPSLRSILIPNNLDFAPLFDMASTVIWILSLLAILSFFFQDLTKDGS